LALRKRRRGGRRRVKRLYGVLVRILICDDNVDAANTWAALLDSEGHDVRICHFGTAYVQEALTWLPQAALVDIGLPGMDGYAVARALRASPGGAAVLLIAVTGYSRPEDLARSKAAGFDHHFRKPADVDEVLRALQLRPDRT
jgi:two-component system, sensor histidine kinase